MTTDTSYPDFDASTSASAGEFSVLRKIKGFPFDLWTAQHAVLSARRDWYKGYPLKATFVDPDTGKTLQKYPLEVNPFKSTARKHAAMVLGQNHGSESVDNLPVQFKLSYKDEKIDTKAVEEVISEVLEESKASALFLSSAIQSQYLGGLVLTASYDHVDGKIVVSSPSSIEFLGIPNGADLWDLRESWTVRAVDESTAVKEYGYRKSMMSRDSTFFYVEHWTKEEYTIYINEQIATINGKKAQGNNPYLKVPSVYIPHLREDTYIGESIVTNASIGVVKEYNLRIADVGDAASADSHANIVAGNLKQQPTIKIVGDREYIDLGSNTSIAGNSDAPFMKMLSSTSVSDPILKLIDELMAIYRREVNHPAVADGEDEGSQRSSLTIATRMWPMIAEVEAERVFWSAGLSVLVKRILLIAKEKGLHKISEQHLDPKVTIQWHPMMLRDRKDIADEAGIRATHKLTSRKALGEKFGDVDPEEDAIQLEKEAKEDAAKIPQIQPQPQQETKSSSER